VYGYPNELWTLKRVEALIQQQRGDFLATLKGLGWKGPQLLLARGGSVNVTRSEENITSRELH